MKIKYFLLLFTFLACKQTSSIIPYENRVILTIDEFNLFSKSKTWEPDENKTIEILLLTYNYLKNYNPVNEKYYTDPTEVKKVFNNFSKYKVQFVGIYENNQRIIHCNFFIDENNSFNNWRKDYIFIKDGGFYYWKISFNIETGKVQSFSINGYS